MTDSLRQVEEGQNKTNKEKQKGRIILFVFSFFLISFTEADLCKSAEIPIGIYLSALEM